MRRWLAAIVLALCIQGCVPAPVKYWSPTAGGAKVVNTNCGTAAAPASTLEYSLGDVLMHVEGKDNHAKLQLMVPAGSRVHLQEAEAYIRVSGMDGKKYQFLSPAFMTSQEIAPSGRALSNQWKGKRVSMLSVQKTAAIQ